MRTTRKRIIGLIFAFTFPTILTWFYFVFLAEHDAGKAVYVVGKIVQFAFPLVWILLVLGEKVSVPRPTCAGLAISVAFGLAVLAAMLLVYHLALKPTGMFNDLALAVETKLAEMWVNQLSRYLVLSVFYVICHSFLEEYYWRWFVYGQMRCVCPRAVAAVVSSLGFMAHHVILLGTYLDWHGPMTSLFSVAVAVGGVVWAWIYQRSGSLYGPWMSHLLIDAAIFLIGYDLAHSLF